MKRVLSRVAGPVAILIGLSVLVLAAGHEQFSGKPPLNSTSVTVGSERHLSSPRDVCGGYCGETSGWRQTGGQAQIQYKLLDRQRVPLGTVTFTSTRHAGRLRHGVIFKFDPTVSRATAGEVFEAIVGRMLGTDEARRLSALLGGHWGNNFKEAPKDQGHLLTVSPGEIKVLPR
jgi:hypothetical protein